MRKKVELYLPSNSEHLSQVLTGFIMLQNKSVISLSYISKELLQNQFELPNSHTLLAFVDGKTIAFDMADGYNRHGFDYEEFLRNVDFYFKRSFSTEKNMVRVQDYTLRKKMYPYGLNFFVTCRNNPLALNFHPRCWQIFKQPPFSPNDFECVDHTINDPPIILFYARLWDPKTEKSYTDEELSHINEMRIAIIRKLRVLYPDSFWGGIQDSEFAREMCPDLVLDGDKSNKAYYLNLVKKADICIGSIGLHESIGWKTAEYVAASKAIVNEEFRYEIPGDFLVGKNYLSFTSVEECLNHVSTLVRNPDRIQSMMKENQLYYKKYGRPKQLILNALKTAKIL